MRFLPSKWSAIFLDRDGVICREVSYLRSIRHLRLLPRAARSVRRLNQAGVSVILATNQSVVARKGLSPARLEEIHEELARRLAKAGAHLDAIYICPHHPTDGAGKYRRVCACRKPKPGMLLRAAKEHGIRLSQSVMIGDKLSDLEAGRRAGCATVLVLSGQGRETCRQMKAMKLAGMADVVCTTFPRAVDWCLGLLGRKLPGKRQ